MHLNTMLLRAAEDGDLQRARMLIKAGAHVNCTDQYGFTPLHGTESHVSYHHCRGPSSKRRPLCRGGRGGESTRAA